MKPGNKRSDAWYAPLSDTDMWAAYDQCVKMRPWQRAVAWIQDKHGLVVKKTSYYAWLDWCRENGLEHTLRSAHQFQQETRKIIAETGDIDATLQEGVAALALDAAADKDLGSLANLVRGLGQLRKSELETARAKIAAQDARIKELEAELGKRPTMAAATPEEKDRRIRETFGVAVKK